MFIHVIAMIRQTIVLDGVSGVRRQIVAGGSSALSARPLVAGVAHEGGQDRVLVWTASDTHIKYVVNGHPWRNSTVIYTSGRTNYKQIKCIVSQM
jgi:hypothetical protein